MELFGLLLAVPVTFVTATIYCCGAAFVLTRLRVLRRVALFGSLLVGLCILIEIVLLGTLGAKAAYSRLFVGFTVIHEISFWLGPPAVANLVLLALSTRSDTWKLPTIVVASLICWFVCMGALVGHIAVDEAIVGVDAGMPFYLTNPH
jgi:hypothetical protein